jgi:hypothetical protein
MLMIIKSKYRYFLIVEHKIVIKINQRNIWFCYKKITQKEEKHKV